MLEKALKGSPRYWGTLIALGLIGISLALIYLGLKDLAKQGGGMGGGSGDPLGDILNDYE